MATKAMKEDPVGDALVEEPKGGEKEGASEEVPENGARKRILGKTDASLTPAGHFMHSFILSFIHAYFRNDVSNILIPFRPMPRSYPQVF